MFRLRLFGGLSLETDSNRPLGRATQKRRLALLAVLATRPGTVITRDKLLALFWPEVSSDDARPRLSAALYDLRRALGDEAINSRGDEISIAPGTLECDAVEFEAAIERRDWRSAARLHRGPFLDGVHLGNAPEFDEWADQRREHLARACRRALEEWASACSQQGDHAGAVEVWERLAGSDPLNDRFALGIMRAFEAAGNRAGALRHAAAHEQRLRADLDVEPDRAVREYAAQLRAAPAPLSITAGLAATPAQPVLVPDIRHPTPPEPMRPHAPRPNWFARVAVLAILLSAPLVWRIVPAVADTPAYRAGAIDVGAAMRDGEAHLLAGRFEPAVAAYERAITLDSSYAPAHFRLAMATLWADLPGDRIRRATAGAVTHRDALGGEERMLLDGFLAWRRGEWHQAEGVYRRALAANPAYTAARQELGEVLFHYGAPQGRSLDEARLEFERVLEREPRHFGALWHLAQIAARDWRKDEVDRLTSRMLALEPDAVRTLEVESLRHAVLGDAARFDKLIDRLRDADESLLLGLGWRLGTYARRFDAADRVFALLTAPGRAPHARAIGHMQRLYLDLAQDRVDAAVDRLDTLATLRSTGMAIDWLAVLTVMSAPSHKPASTILEAWRDSLANIAGDPVLVASLHPRTRVAHLTMLGAMDAVLGHSARALKIAEQLDSRSPPDRTWLEVQADASRAATIRALVARQAGRHEDVIHWTDRSLVGRWFGDALANPVFAYSVERFIRAEAFLALGRHEEADAWFGTIGAHDPSDLVFLPAALRHLSR